MLMPSYFKEQTPGSPVVIPNCTLAAYLVFVQYSLIQMKLNRITSSVLSSFSCLALPTKVQISLVMFCRLLQLQSQQNSILASSSKDGPMMKLIREVRQRIHLEAEFARV